MERPWGAIQQKLEEGFGWLAEELDSAEVDMYVAQRQKAL